MIQKDHQLQLQRKGLNHLVFPLCVYHFNHLFQANQINLQIVENVNIKIHSNNYFQSNNPQAPRKRSESSTVKAIPIISIRFNWGRPTSHLIWNPKHVNPMPKIKNLKAKNKNHQTKIKYPTLTVIMTSSGQVLVVNDSLFPLHHAPHLPVPPPEKTLTQMRN